MAEIWKQVTDFPYEVSNYGRVRSQLASKTTDAGHILRTRSVGAGYLGVSLYRDGRKFDRYVHRLVASAFINGDNSLPVNHKDGDKTNNIPENLEFCTHKDNVAHAWNMKLLPAPPIMIGRNNPRTKITEEIASKILLWYYRDGCQISKIAQILLITRTTVENVVYRRCWKYLKLPH